MLPPLGTIVALCNICLLALLATNCCKSHNPSRIMQLCSTDKQPNVLTISGEKPLKCRKHVKSVCMCSRAHVYIHEEDINSNFIVLKEETS